MKILQGVVFVCVLFAVHVQAQETRLDQPEAQPPVRFKAVDVYVDSGDEPLAAYQFEFAAETGEIKIVGIEGGEHAAFKEPPYYDPAALSKNTIIIAAFNTGQNLPRDKTRVARLHVQVMGEAEPEYVVKLEVAASPEGKKIAASATLEKGEQK